MQNCLAKVPQSSRSFCRTKVHPVFYLILALATLAGSFYSIVKLYQIWLLQEAPTYTYLVKLKSVPIFNDRETGHEGQGWDILVDNGANMVQFDNLLRHDHATVEDLFPEHNDGELGKWVKVTSHQPMGIDLLDDTPDVVSFEDARLTLSIPEDEEYGWRIQTNEDNRYDIDHGQTLDGENVRNDKTWGLRLPKVAEALKALKPTRQVLVAVVDTGCDLKHPALSANLVKGHNFAGGDPEDASNRNGNEMHATHVTGTIVAKPDKFGFYGIAHTVAKVMPVRVLNESGSGSYESVSQGVVWAADHGAEVINMSLGGTHNSDVLHDACKYAANNKKVKILCAKGNSATNRPHYPSDYPEVMCVTATALKEDGSEERAYFSNYGTNSTCAAPGHFIYSTLPGGKYGFASGTSMACPHAAGCVAVMLSQGDLNPDNVRSTLQTRGDVLKTDKPIGKRVNLLNFVEKGKHDLMTPHECLNHPYGQCCINAGIMARFSTIEGDSIITCIYEDADDNFSISGLDKLPPPPPEPPSEPREDDKICNTSSWWEENFATVWSPKHGKKIPLPLD